MSRSEDEIQQLIRIEAAKFSSVLFRNNTGVLPDQNGRPVRYGLCNESAAQNKNLKSSDLIGIIPITVTHDMVGKTIGVFVAIEVKKEKWKFKGDERETAQLNFINWVKKLGGFAGFASSIDDLKEIIRG